jgi:hypothetical protein
MTITKSIERAQDLGALAGRIAEVMAMAGEIAGELVRASRSAPDDATLAAQAAASLATERMLRAAYEQADRTTELAGRIESEKEHAIVRDMNARAGSV